MNPLAIDPHNVSQAINKLTPRQLEIISYLAQGKSNKQVGYLLSIGTTTVKRHIYNACHRLDVENKTQLIVLYAMWRVTIELVNPEYD